MRVLVVEDVATVAATIEGALRRAGMDVLSVGTGAAALAERERFRPEVVLLDLTLPDTDGLRLVTVFTDDGAGVIIVTASGEEAARVTALDIGADDYMVKPVMVRELAARVRAVHRRLQGRILPGAVPPVASGLVANDRPSIHVDGARRQLLAPDGRIGALTEAEMLAFEALLEAEGNAVSREWISRTALKRPVHADDRSVDQLVMKLRRKLAALGCPERTILSVRRQGYVMADPALFQRLAELRQA